MRLFRQAEALVYSSLARVAYVTKGPGQPTSAEGITLNRGIRLKLLQFRQSGPCQPAIFICVL